MKMNVIRDFKKNDDNLVICDGSLTRIAEIIETARYRSLL